MQLILQILGGLFLALIALALLAAWAVRRKLRDAVRSLESLQHVAQPARIRLVPRGDLEWRDPAAVDALSAPLVAAGFQQAGEFGAQEFAALRLRALVHREQAVHAVVYEYDQAGVWIDLVTRYEDGTSITYTTTPHGQELDQRPGHGKITAAGEDPARLYHRLLAERPRRPFLPASPDQFRAVFEQAYADAMDWRNSRGGPTESEIRAIAEASGEQLTDEMLRSMQESQAREAAEGLCEALRERFLAETEMPAREWETVRERVCFIHDRLLPDMVVEQFAAGAPAALDEEGEDWEALEESIRGETPRRGFARLNDRLPEDTRFEKIGELSLPVPADVYRAPAS